MSILLPTNMVNGLDTDLARLTPLETDVAALKPGALQTFSGDLVYDFSSLIQTDICDFTINVYGLSGTVNDANVWMQLSSDGGTSWISTGYYASSHYSLTSATSSYASDEANLTQWRVSYISNAGPTKGPTGYWRIRRVGAKTTIEGSSIEYSTAGQLMVWDTRGFLDGHDTNALRLYWSSGSTDGGRYSIQDNLRQP